MMSVVWVWAPEGDGAAAQADVVRGGGPGHGAGLSPTFPPPTASKMWQMSPKLWVL